MRGTSIQPEPSHRRADRERNIMQASHKTRCRRHARRDAHNLKRN